MNEDELNALVDAKLAERVEARLKAERARVREETILELRREASNAHFDKINAKAPIEGPLAGLTVAQEEERQRQMAERSRATCAKMDAANARVVPGMRSALRTTAADGAAGGSAFRIKT
jgi:hypothetical protein